MNRVTRTEMARVALLAGISLAPLQIQAAGFALIEQGASGMGNAFAGGSAIAEDASTIYFNPAGMTRLDGMQALAAGHLIVPQADVQTVSGGQSAGTIPISGSIGGDGGVTGLVPNLYFVNRISDDVTLGLGINVPFGLSTKYDDDWIGRYHAVKSEVKTINVNPSIALKLNDTVSLGFGLNAQYLDATLTSAIDAGFIDAANFMGAFGFTPGSASNDGLSYLTGDSWGWGFNLGGLFNLDEQTRLGVAYRSKIEHTVKGTVDITLPSASAVLPVVGNVTFAQALASTGLRDAGAKVIVELPATFSVSLYHDLTPEWAVMADWTWTEWSSLPELRVQFDSGLSDNVTTWNWQDTNRYSIGTTFRPSGSRWAFRGGVAYDETAIPDAKHRTPRLPGEDRLWVAIGAGYKVSDSLQIDVGYSHLFIDDPQISKPGTDAEDALRGALDVNYEASVDILSAQAVWHF